MKKYLSLALLLLLAGISFASETEKSVKGDVIVVLQNTTGNSIKASDFQSGNAVSAVSAFIQDSNVSLKATYPSLSEASNSFFMVVHSDTKSETDLLEELRNRPDVKAVSLNRKVQIMESKREPNDPDYYRQWALQTIKAPQVWSSYTGSEDVYAAVIDTGIDPDHEDLKDLVATEYCRNFTGYGENPDDVDIEDWRDVHDHGSHCSGIIGAMGNNSKGISGVNWRTKLIAIRTFRPNGSGDTADIMRGLDYIIGLLIDNPDMKLASVNLSLGGMEYESPEERENGDDAYWLTYKTLSDLNRTVICVSAGNLAIEVGAPTQREAFYSSGSLAYPKNIYVYPASFRGIDNMIVVAASTQANLSASFSNYSRKYVHVASPGYQIFSTVRSNVSQDTALDSYTRYPYVNMSGTSMAAPYVAGVCAMLKSIFPDASASEIKSAVLGGANGDYIRDTGESMYGLLDLNEAMNFMKRNRLSRAKPVIAEAVLPEPVINQSYNFEFTASGHQPITFSIMGNLPDGMTFDNGRLAGTPTSITENSFTVIADNDYGTTSRTFSFNISEGIAPTISDALNKYPEFYRGNEYSFPIAVAGTYPIEWELMDSSIPSDFNFNLSEDEGEFTVTPTQTGRYVFTVKATNSAGSDTKQLSFEVAESEAPVIEAKTLKAAILGQKYGITSTADVIDIISEDAELGESIEIKGTKPFKFKITQGKLPEGIEWASARKANETYGGTIRIGGIPEETGVFDFTLTATNDYGTASQDFSITVSGGKPEFVDINTQISMPAYVYSEANAIYAVGKAPMTITLVDGNLPNGTEIKQGSMSAVICGTATETGTFNLKFRAANDEGTSEQNVILKVVEQPIILDTVLPDGRQDEAYDYTLRTLKNIPGTFEALSVPGYELPNGLTFSASGNLSGVPTEAGKYNLLVTVRTSDSAASQLLPLNIKEPVPMSAVGSSSGGCNALSGVLCLALLALRFRKH